MTKKTSVAAILKALEDRAANDERFLNNLNKIDEILAGCPDQVGDIESGRSNLPYSSDPPIFDSAWN